MADAPFTAAALFQPGTGYLPAHEIGWSLTEGWNVLSLRLYVLTGFFWLPVAIQIRNLAYVAVAGNAALPRDYFRLYRIWLACGLPAFLAIIGILWLMPTIQLF